MNGYFQAVIPQQIERGKNLIGRIPSNLPREFQILEQNCRRDLARLLDSLRVLLTDQDMMRPDHQPERLRQFRRIVSDMSILETVAVASLERVNVQHDAYLNNLVERIREEIRYPLLSPVVTPFSQDYFHIFPKLNLLRVPLAESDFLLHLPDLYHELAHPLVDEKDDPRVQPFRQQLGVAIGLVQEYIANELEKESRRRGPDMMKYYLSIWDKSWWKWMIEFFCDLFAIYTIGPAFAWAHFHLFAKHGGNSFEFPYSIPTSHPADDARMKAMLYGLGLIGFDSEVPSIKQRWNDILSLTANVAEPEYARCYPTRILKDIATLSLKGVAEMGCRIASPQTEDSVYVLLNEVWDQLWRSPSDFAVREKVYIARLRESIQSG